MAGRDSSDGARPRGWLRGRRLRWMAGALLLLGGVAWFAPSIAVRLGVVDRMVAGATADFAGDIQLGRVSLG